MRSRCDSNDQNCVFQMHRLREAFLPVWPPGQAPQGPPEGPALLVPRHDGLRHPIQARPSLPKHPQQRGREVVHPKREHRHLRRLEVKTFNTPLAGTSSTLSWTSTGPSTSTAVRSTTTIQNGTCKRNERRVCKPMTLSSNLYLKTWINWPNEVMASWTTNNTRFKSCRNGWTRVEPPTLHSEASCKLECQLWICRIADINFLLIQISF